MAVVDYPLTHEECVEALKNEIRDIRETYNPSTVLIQNQTASEGNMCLLKFTVKAPSFYIEAENDISPKPTEEMMFFVSIPNGFPKVKPSVYYPPERRLASVNVFRNGYQCIDEWKPSSSLEGVVRKTIMDIIHDPVVTRYDSMANSSLEKWQKEKTEQGILPTCDMNRLMVRKSDFLPELPKRESVLRSKREAPPLPVRI